MSGELILLVDDEPHILQLSRMYLEKNGFVVEAVQDGKSALEAVKSIKPALIVLDLMLPGIDGLEVCRLIRAERYPTYILILTARDEDIDKILGLELGADDYLTKPFNPRELIARIKAILRRPEHHKNASEKVLFAGNLVVNPTRREVSIDGKQLQLRTKEFDLLRVLVEHKGIAFNWERLLELVWGYDYFGQTRTVDVHIGQLRKKLVGSSIRIETITGVGYKLIHQ